MDEFMFSRSRTIPANPAIGWIGREDGWITTRPGALATSTAAFADDVAVNELVGTGDAR